MSVYAFDPRVLESTPETLTVGIGDKTRRDRMTESGQGGADKNPGQEQALDGQGLQEFVLSRPHCCPFLCFCLLNTPLLLIVLLTSATGQSRRGLIRHPHSTFCLCLYVYAMVSLSLFTRYDLLFGVFISIGQWIVFFRHNPISSLWFAL